MSNDESKTPASSARSRAQGVLSFIRPKFLQRRRSSEEKEESAESRVKSLHQRIQDEFSHKSSGSTTNENVTDDSKCADNTDCNKTISRDGKRKTKKSSRDKNDRPKINPLQKSDRMKQLEEFRNEREAKAKAKKRQDRIEKEAKREVDKEIAELEALQAEAEEKARQRAESAAYWTETARLQQQEARLYDRFLAAREEEKQRVKAMGGDVRFKPSARRSYEEWLAEDESERRALAQAAREGSDANYCHPHYDHQHREQKQQQQQCHSGLSANDDQTQCGGDSVRFSGGSLRYHASMIADDEDDDLGGTSSALTEEELACGMHFERLQIPGEGGGGGDKLSDAPVTSGEMRAMLQPRDWMSLQSEVAPVCGRSCMGPGDYNDNEGGDEGGSSDSCPVVIPRLPAAPAAKKQTTKSAISEYNASRNKARLSSKPSSHSTQYTALGQRSCSDSGHAFLQEEARAVSDAEMNRLKRELKICQAEEEMQQLLQKQSQHLTSLEKVEEAIEKIDTLLYRRENDLEIAISSTDGSENNAIVTQLRAIIEKLKQSQKMAEMKKDVIDDQVFSVEKEMKKLSAHLKALKADTGPASTENKTVQLPLIPNKHSV